MARSIIGKINGVYDYLLSKGVSTKVMDFRLKAFDFQDEHAELEEEWVEKWKCLGKPNRHLYRLYSGFIGPNVNIVPDDIMSNVIEPILNPVRYRSVYEDKNMIDRFLQPHYNRKVTPGTILRSIGTILFDKEYNQIKNCDVNQLLQRADYPRIIVKPSIDANSGKGILFFDKDSKDGRYYELSDGKELSIDFLDKEYKADYIIQECVRQSDFMAQFCPTSINTFRMHAYRSVTSNEPLIIGSVMRMGGSGSLLDNMHAGGGVVGVEPSGRLQNFKRDQHGDYGTIHNGIDLTQEYIVPNYQECLDFGANILNCIPHCRNLALDVMIGKDGHPMLIEYNTDKFGCDVFQMTVGTLFESYTDELIDYCKSNLDKKTRIFVTF